MAKNTTFVALTTTGSGWDVVLVGEPGESRDSVEDRAETAIVRRNGDQPNAAKSIWTDTELKNLVIVTKTRATRRFSGAWADWNDPERLVREQEDADLQAEIAAEYEAAMAAQ